MSDEIVVFLGPTLPRERACRHLAACYMPPAEQGTVFDVAQSLRPRAIVLIDGAFAKVPAVRHKEILWAMSRGIEVYGAASIGALRAAELAAVGMKGFGLVYRWYRATPFADDDEVAVAMTPAELGAQPLGEALINIRLTLRRAERADVLPRDMRRALEDLAASTYFLERTYARLFDQAQSLLPRHWLALLDNLKAWVGDNATDQKQADALGLLRCLAAGADPTRVSGGTPPVAFVMTEAWAADLDAAGLYSDSLVHGPKQAQGP
jgi:hypothetical protein